MYILIVSFTIIKDGGYATSLTYVEKLCSIIEKWNLTDYDAKDSDGEVIRWYRVRRTWADSKTQKGAYKILDNAKKCADPRALAMWLARKYTRAALTEIGEFFGGRRHSAVISAQKKVDRWLEEHEAIASPSGVFTVQETLERLERSLGVARV